MVTNHLHKFAFLLFCFLAGLSAPLKAQIVLSTTSQYLNNNGSGTVTFNLENTNAFDVIVTDISGVTGTTGSVNVEFYYNPTPVSGAPGAISAANGWNLVTSATITGIGNSSTTTTQPFLSGMNFIIPANTTYGIAIFATGQRYFTMPAGPTTISAGGVNMLAGTNISFAGGTPPASPTNSPRGWIGTITMIPAIPCGGIPTAGTATALTSTACPNGPVNLTLSGYTLASGITIQWEETPSGLGMWTPIMNANAPNLVHTQSMPMDYRAVVTCSNGGASDISNPVSVGASPFYLCYCSPNSGVALHTTTGNYITGVSIPSTTLAATTATVGAGGYTQHDPNISSNTAILTQGQFYDINATIASASYHTELWIDWDQSGIFDPGEYYALGQGTALSSQIQVPATAVPGLTGMRLRSTLNATTIYGPSGACASITNGRETEDFVITIAPAVQCSGAPSSGGTASISMDTICVGGQVTLDLSSLPTELGLAFQWQESPAGQNIWNNITGANTISYTVSNINQSMDYRMEITCTNPGGSTAYSNTVSVHANNPQVIGTTPGSRCGVGTVNLAAVADPGNTINWYDVATGGAPLVMGSTTFTTPTISTTTTYYAEAVAGGGNVDSVNIPLNIGSTTGVYHHMFMVSATNTLTLDELGIKCNNAASSMTSWDIYYRPDNYQSIPGANASSTGWTLLASTNVPSLGPNFYTPIATGLSLTIPAGQTYSFYVAPGTGVTHQYNTSALGTVVSSNADASLIAGNRGSSLFSVTTNGGMATVNLKYSTGCPGLRVPVVATITPPPAMTVSTTDDTLCLGQTATLSVSSANAYSYTWTPGGSGSSINVSPTATTTYYLDAVDGSNCTNADTIEIAVVAAPAAVTTVASSTTVCVSDTVVFSLDPQPMAGLTYQWQIDIGTGFTDIPGATSATYSESITQDADYRVQIFCDNVLAVSSTPVTIDYSNPSVLNTTPASRCGSGTVTLNATGTPGDVISWYDAATGGVALDTGNMFETPVISTSTTYYVAAGSAGALMDSIPLPAHGSNYSGNVRGFYFTAPVNFTITGLKALAQTTGNQSLAVIKFDNNTPPPIYGLTTNAFTVLYLNQNDPNNGVIPVNIPVNAGEVIGILGQIGSSSSYATPTGPYVTNIAGQPVTLTRMGMQYQLGTSAPQDIWEETGAAIGRVHIDYQIGCESARVPVIATVTPPPGIVTASASPDTICAGTSTTLTATSGFGGYNYSWSPGGATTAVTTETPPFSTSYVVTATDPISGCQELDTVDVVVKAAPATATTIATPEQVCMSGTAGLSLDTLAPFGINYQWQHNTGSGFVDIPGATSPTHSEPITTTTIYQAKILCDNTVVGTSAPDTVRVSNPTIVQTIPGSRCDAGPVTLAAIPSQGATVHWYDVPTGGSPLSMGNAYTTPAINSTTTYYAAAVEGNGGDDSVNVPITTSATTGVYYHMFMVSTTTGMTLNEIGIKCNNTVGSPTGWDVYYRPDNYQSIPGANTSSSGWTLVSSVTGVPSMGTTMYTTIATNLNIVMPPGSTYSFHIAPASGTTHQYGTMALGTVTASNANASIIAGNRGSSLFNCTTNGGMAVVNIGYSLGCIGNRVPVDATINGTTSGTGLSTGGTTTGSMHADGSTVNYTDGCGDMVATVADAPGGNTLGLTTAVVITPQSILTHNGIPYVSRVFDLAPSSPGPATVTLYALQSEFNDYNSFVTANSLSLPLLPTGPSDAAGMANIVVTQFHGSPLDSNTGPGGLYNDANASFIPNSAINVTWAGGYWAMTFPVTGFSGFFIHSGSTPLQLQLADFTARNFGSRNRIDWTTLSEREGDIFYVEHSADGKVFTELGSVSGKGAASTYSFWDEHPVQGENHYRLKSKDVRGSLSYSKIVKVWVDGQGAFDVTAFPNPVSDELNIRLMGEPGPNSRILITDVAGKLIQVVEMNTTTATIQMNGLAQGVYLLQYSDDHRKKTLKINKK